MKKALLLSLAIVCLAGSAFAQGGTIAVYADPLGTSCYPVDAGAGLAPMYVVHTAIAGATASQFSAPIPGCMTASIWLSDTPVFAVTIGNSQGGVAIGYGACLGAPIHVLTINYFVQGLTGPCCQLDVLPDPNVLSGVVEVVDCLNNLVTGNGGTTFINGNDTDCPCQLVGTEETTWGQVKSLYQGE